MKKIFGLLIALVLVGAVAAYGQAIGDLKGKMAGTVFLDYGIGFGDQFKSITLAGEGFEITAKNKLNVSFGGKFMYGVAPKIAVAGILDYQMAKAEASATIAGFGSTSTSANYHIFEISANGMYFFSPEKKLCPYIEAGPGMYSFGGSGSSSTKIGVNAGFGGAYMINEKIAIDAGGRFHMVFTDVKNTTYVDIHAGVSFFFGATK